MRSGGTSLTHPPTPDSEPARYFSLPGAAQHRHHLQVQARDVAARVHGAWCQAAM